MSSLINDEVKKMKYYLKAYYRLFKFGPMNNTTFIYTACQIAKGKVRLHWLYDKGGDK